MKYGSSTVDFWICRWTVTWKSRSGWWKNRSGCGVTVDLGSRFWKENIPEIWMNSVKWYHWRSMKIMQIFFWPSSLICFRGIRWSGFRQPGKAGNIRLRLRRIQEVCWIPTGIMWQHVWFYRPAGKRDLLMLHLRINSCMRWHRFHMLQDFFHWHSEKKSISSSFRQ